MSTKIFMQFNDIKGEGLDPEHTNWIELNSLDFSVSRCIFQESGSATREIGKASISSIHIHRKMDISSHKILSEVLGGFGTDLCTIHFCGDNGTYLEYILSNAVISGYNVHHSDSSYAPPSESFTISFTRIQTKYILKENGSASICAGYDISTATNL